MATRSTREREQVPVVIMARGSFGAPSIHGVLTRMHSTLAGVAIRNVSVGRTEYWVEFGVVLVGDILVTPVA